MKKLSISLLLVSMAILAFGQKDPKAQKDKKVDPIIYTGGFTKAILKTATIQTGTYIIKSAIDGKNMDVINGTNGNGIGIHLWDAHDGDAQQFTIEPSNEAGYYLIKTKWGRAVDVAGYNTASGAALNTYDVHNGDNQKWQFIDKGDGYYNIMSKYGTYIDVQYGNSASGTPIWMSAYSTWGNNIAQKWKLDKKATIITTWGGFGGVALQRCIVVYEQPNYQGRSEMYCDAGNFNLPFVVRSIRVPDGFVLKGWEGEFQQDFSANNSSFILGSYNTAITVGKTTTIPIATWQSTLNNVFGASCVRLNNYTPNQNQYNRNEREFFRPNDSYIKLNLNGSWLNYAIPIDVIQTGQDRMYKMYINDWNTNRIVATPENGRIKITLYFEDDGVEIVGRCYNHGLCAFSPAPNFNYSNSRIDIYLDLIASGGQLSYNASNVFTANVAESGPCVNNFFGMFCPSDRTGLIKGTVESTINQHLNSSGIKPLLSSMLTRLAPSGTSVNRVSVNARGDISIW